MSGTNEWWRPQLEERLSQGDIVREIPFVTAVHPLEPLNKQTFSGNRQAWSNQGGWTVDGGGHAHALGRGAKAPAIVLSHDCELDKTGKKAQARVLVAPILPMSRLDLETQAAFKLQTRKSALPLPAVPVLNEDYYAELRNITTIDRAFITHGERLASMSDAAKIRLRAQIIAFFTRIDFMDKIAELEEQPE